MTIQCGEARSQAKLRHVDVVAILIRSAAGERLTSIARSYPQVSRVAVHHIIHRRRWKHVTIPCHVADPAVAGRPMSAGKVIHVTGRSS